MSELIITDQAKRIFKEKLIALLMCCLVIELALFKFTPDLAHQVYQNQKSALTSFDVYESQYMTPDSVMYPRFLGNMILFELAEFISSIFEISDDIRLHPLRIAAGILTPIYFILGAFRAVFGFREINWKVFLTYYSLMFFSGMYVFYPYDAPSIAFISLCLSFILRGNILYAFLCFVVAGLFRESSLHVVVLMVVFSFVNRFNYARNMKLWMWVGVFLVTYVVEYEIIRYFYPGPVTSNGYIDYDPTEIILGDGFLSLTTIVTLPLALLFPINYYVLRDQFDNNWIREFISINCLLVPFWVLFYRAMGGNIPEFRILWPVLLPCIYGISYKIRGVHSKNHGDISKSAHYPQF